MISEFYEKLAKHGKAEVFFSVLAHSARGPDQMMRGLLPFGFDDGLVMDIDHLTSFMHDPNLNLEEFFDTFHLEITL